MQLMATAQTVEMPQIYHPSSHQSFDLSPPSAEPSRPSTPPSEQTTLNPESNAGSSLKPQFSPTRNSSIVNLTSSTLQGIYGRLVGDAGRDDLSTPWGTGAQTPALREDQVPQFKFPQYLDQSSEDFKEQRRPPLKRSRIPVVWQTFFLFAFGIGFGLVVSHLQRTQQIVTVPVPTFAKSSWLDQFVWGVLGVAIGNILPRIDMLLENEVDLVNSGEQDIKKVRKLVRSKSSRAERPEFRDQEETENGMGPMWHSVVRSIGAFVGIAFAVRRLPWHSTLQVALTLAATNPVLWYIIDRSISGFALSTGIGIVGSFLLMLVSPDYVPVPAIHQGQPSEQIGVYTWLASILFCTTLCFGAIGRKLSFST